LKLCLFFELWHGKNKKVKISKSASNLLKFSHIIVMGETNIHKQIVM